VASALYAFGPYQLDPSARRLLRGEETVTIPSRQLDILVLLVTHAGQLLSKDALIEAAWPGIAVTDNSLEQAISGLRRTLGGATGAGYIETAARRGYRFAVPVTRVDRRETVETLEALLAPHKAWIEGRAALETLERGHIVHAREVFERVLAQVPDQAPAHVGLSNACILQFEMTRADLRPDIVSLAAAAEHAREACRLDPRYGEAWATLGFVLDRTGHRADALAASRMAVSLEPDNWRHHLRLAYVGWGEERLRAARRTLALLPGFPLAHWLAATVHVARQALDEADRELAAGLEAQGSPNSRFSSVAVHWLYGLVRLARGDEQGALEAFEQELARESSGHLYARECCANTWYAIGAVRLRHEDVTGAVNAFQEAVARVPLHPVANVALAALAAEGPVRRGGSSRGKPAAHARAVLTADPHANAVQYALEGNVEAAIAIIDAGLTAAPEGSAFWTVPVDPMLRAHGDDRWAAVLARLRNRAA
jgi:DNA-binding winged helix-turn-helix (wHTH) protein